MHIQMFVESQFWKFIFSVWASTEKYDGLQKIAFGASVRQSGFQRMHIQFFGESQLWKFNCSIGAWPRNYDGLHKITFFGHQGVKKRQKMKILKK